MALTVAGPVGCKQGLEGGGRREGKVRFGLIDGEIGWRLNSRR
jgi:hypothetical protein